MKLTVGPLPPAVYWRRRAVVLGALLVTLFLLVYSCSGAKPSDASNTPGAGQLSSQPAGSPSPTAAVSSTPLLTPTIGTPPPTDPFPGTSESPIPPAATGQCTDAEMSVVPVPEAATVRQGLPLKISLKIKNISNRTCTREVGATAQELYIQQGTTKMWSSDACDALTGSAVRTFPPGLEIEAYVPWNGRATSQGCANRPWAPIGTYQVFGRLATKFSDPVPLQVNA